jgi:hypothetical protein
MYMARLGWADRGVAALVAAPAAVFAAILTAAPLAEAHGGVSIGIGFGFPGFIGAPVYAPPVYYAPPPVYYSAPYVAYGPPPPPVYRRHYHRARHYRYCCCCY